MFHDRQGQYNCFLFYATIRINSQIHVTYSSSKDINYGVFQKCLGISRDNDEMSTAYKYYACVSNEWLYRNKGGSFSLPVLNTTIEQYINTYR